MSTRPASLTIEPIGVLRTPFQDRYSAPRQPTLAAEVEGRIELYPRAEVVHGLADITAWSHLWVLYWFHLNASFKPKVEAPRSLRKLGVFATRSPYRPNPIGLSVVKLERVEDNVLHVRGLDMVDGTPVLDIKPYVPYSDIVPEANSGWLPASMHDVTRVAVDPGPVFSVELAERASSQLAWLRARGIDLLPHIERVLTAGPAPHPYRRIKRDGDCYVLGAKDWRVRFDVEHATVRVRSIATGYKPRALHDPKTTTRGETPLDVHRAFVSEFGLSG